MSKSPFQMVVHAGFAFVVSLCIGSQAQGQGFRIGNVVEAGGGQGFRIGGPRMGMHFGGGQGASIGGQNFGMRFGNGQGARIGGLNYGLQFGGGQGTQIGQFQTYPSGTPGTYYYGDVRGGRVQPRYAGPTARPTLARRYNSPSGLRIQQNIAMQPTLAVPAGGSPVATTTSAATGIEPAVNLDGMIRLSHSPNAPGDFAYRLNGTDFQLAPGKSVYMKAGQDWVVEFSAGEGHGSREATLNESGDYLFQQSEDEGWVLVNNQPSVPSVATAATPETPANPARQPPTAAPVAQPTPAQQQTPVETPQPTPVVESAADSASTPAIEPPANTNSDDGK